MQLLCNQDNTITVYCICSMCYPFNPTFRYFLLLTNAIIVLPYVDVTRVDVSHPRGLTSQESQIFLLIWMALNGQPSFSFVLL